MLLVHIPQHGSVPVGIGHAPWLTQIVRRKAPATGLDDHRRATSQNPPESEPLFHADSQ
ncbi:hypothetical protein ACFSKM_22530 [Ancylobacter dichloromethanicus]